MNPELRCKMLHNRFAGKALKKVDMLYDAGITMNGQIVLCKGVNDGDELEYSLAETVRLCSGSSECFCCAGRSDQITVKVSIRWSLLIKKMQKKFWSQIRTLAEDHDGEVRDSFYPCFG